MGSTGSLGNTGNLHKTGGLPNGKNHGSSNGVFTTTDNLVASLPARNNASNGVFITPDEHEKVSQLSPIESQTGNASTGKPKTGVLSTIETIVKTGHLPGEAVFAANEPTELASDLAKKDSNGL